ncbi:MAG: DNA-binding protein [Tissierellia bacterium]|nr:DNA-binding protein [Tissierellia bacterium]
MVDKLVEIGILFDFYGKLLSKKQYSVVELYYLHDLSLAEIGEELDISRQGVYDILKRAEENLYQYEERLNLVKKFYKNEKTLEEIYKLAQDIEEETRKIDNRELQGKVNDLIDKIRKIIDINQEGF